MPANQVSTNDPLLNAAREYAQAMPETFPSVESAANAYAYFAEKIASERVEQQVATLSRKVEILTRGLEHYADESTWNQKAVTVTPCPPGIAYAGQRTKGYDLAQAALAEARKEGE